jgi:hypothetical protein
VATLEPVFSSSRASDGTEILTPTDSAVGPWNPEHLHGGPTCGMIARAAERLVGELDMQPARLTVDLFRPVPRRPLVAQSSYAREGRRIRAVQVSVLDGDTEVARGSVLYLLRQPMPDVPEWPRALERMAGPEGIETTGILRGRAPGAEPGFHMRVQARWSTPPKGLQAAWFRMPMALVDDEPVTPFQRVAVLGDFANAVASLSTVSEGRPRVAFMNTDTTLYIARLPRGEWIGMQADHSVAAEGVEVAEVVHHDAGGRYGRSTQARMMMSGPPGSRPRGGGGR